MNGNGNSHIYLEEAERFAAGAMVAAFLQQVEVNSNGRMHALDLFIERRWLLNRGRAHARVGEWSENAEARCNFACTASGVELQLHVCTFHQRVVRGQLKKLWCGRVVQTVVWTYTGEVTGRDASH